MKNPWVITGIIAVLLLGSAVWYSGSSAEKSNEGVEIFNHIKGNNDAIVSLVEYSDFQCPACAAFHPVVADILSEYGDNIKFEYKHFPLPMHTFAQKAAIAAEAAGQQDKFFEYHDLLFANQGEWSVANNPNIFFIKYAEELELDLDKFKIHLNSSLLRDKVKSDLDQGHALGVTGTPSFYLNGEFMDPNKFQTIEGFIEQIVLVVDPESASTTKATNSGVRFGL